MYSSWSPFHFLSPFVPKIINQAGHKPGKPGIFRDFSEHGKLREFCATSGKNCNKLKYF